MIESTDVYTSFFFFHQATSTSGPYLIAEGRLYVIGKSPFPSLYSNHYEEGTGLIVDFRERFNPVIPGYLVTNNDSEKVFYPTSKMEGLHSRSSFGIV